MRDECGVQSLLQAHRHRIPADKTARVWRVKARTFGDLVQPRLRLGRLILSGREHHRDLAQLTRPTDHWRPHRHAAAHRASQMILDGDTAYFGRALIDLEIAAIGGEASETDRRGVVRR
jgi:hypothetical protein